MERSPKSEKIYKNNALTRKILITTYLPFIFFVKRIFLKQITF